MLAKAAVAAALLPTLAFACHDHLERRAVNAARETVDRSTEQSERLILDPNAECAPYGYEPVNEIMASYPPIWATGTMQFAGVPQDATDLFNSIKAGIPAIAPRGTRAGDFAGVTYDANADADCWWTETRCTTPKLKGLATDVTRCPEPNTWGFTLDDGPNCSHNAYFDYLESIKMKATLFYIGSNVLDWPLEAQRGLADGHEICSHTWSHPYMTSMTNEQAFAELYFSKKAIKDVLGVTVRCWRPPYGDVDDRIRWIAQALDMETVIWTDDTFDYDWVTLGMPAIRKNYQAIFDKQTAGAYSTAGAIVLTHEIDNGTMQLSEEMLPQMMKQFTGGVMPVGVCMNNTQPYVEKDAYTYPNYDQWTAGTRSISLALPTATGQASETLVLLTGSAAPTTTSSASLSASAKNTSAVASGSSASRVAAASASASSASAAAAQQANAQKAHSGASSVHTVAGVAALLAGAVAGAAALI
ncbi:hypothetical protein DMC30DRAFT_362037 [Rhodotorula diobovata]|uniref:chitin deacetylase n=1 Tax=Rhodotorula diobovata TaxID=5288 RepID=A0A5C5G1C8_9BASI|nr:hypothetical protein DMC30DRAFT_362037 [Rhodotorula diobovata]